jgi:leucyl aminopeptidase
MKPILLNEITSADLLVVPLREGQSIPSSVAKLTSGSKSLFRDFRGKVHETIVSYTDDSKIPRVMFLGLGSNANEESIRRSFSKAVSHARKMEMTSVQFLLIDEIFDRECLVEASLEGVFLSNYSYSVTKSKKDFVIDQFSFVVSKTRSFDQIIKTVQVVNWVRDIVNRNSDDKTPLKIVEETHSFSSSDLNFNYLGLKEIEKEQMGLILAVNRGSPHEPAIIELTYNGGPREQKPIVLVGKGVTYDTGGLSLKPSDSMLDMRCDMAGAATAIGVLRIASILKLPLNLVAIAPLTENSIDGKSYKLGDVYRSRSGLHVEINNTDAEGRLILADGIDYAISKHNPSLLIDIASLTGAAIVALGEDIAAFWTRSDFYSEKLYKASQTTGEQVWRIPLVDDYKETLKSDIADLRNMGGREGGAIKAALFLEAFTKGCPWIHLDIAGPCFSLKNKFYNTTPATGYGVRLLLNFLKSLT